MFDKGYRIEVYEGDEMVACVLAEPIGNDGSAAVNIFFDHPDHLEALEGVLNHAAQSVGFSAWKHARGIVFEPIEKTEDESGTSNDLSDIPF